MLLHPDYILLTSEWRIDVQFELINGGVEADSSDCTSLWSQTMNLMKFALLRNIGGHKVSHGFSCLILLPLVESLRFLPKIITKYNALARGLRHKVSWMTLKFRSSWFHFHCICRCALFGDSLMRSCCVMCRCGYKWLEFHWFWIALTDGRDPERWCSVSCIYTNTIVSPIIHVGRSSRSQH